jgi:hypothetical protein
MPATEVTDLQIFPPAGQVILAFALDAPVAGEQSESDGFVLSGWVLGQSDPIESINVSESGRALTTLAVGGRRPDVAAAHPGIDRAELSGFEGWVPTVGLGPNFLLEVHAVTASGQQAALGTVAGRRSRSESAHVSPEPIATPASQAMPDFFIIGVQRGGTRSLYEYLSGHPDIQPARTDEVHYFSLFFDRGRRWFQSQFPALAPGQMTGEASPYYVFHPLAAERLHAVAPDAKLIVLLRNPVDRAFSHYQLEVRQGNEPLSFEDAIAAESTRLAGEVERIRDDDTYASFAHQHYSYLARGRYVEQLRRWLTLFPREQLLVLKSEDFYRDPGAGYQRVTDFLGLRPHPLASARIYNRSPDESLPGGVRQRLDAYFAPHNAALSDLVGVEMSWDNAEPDNGVDNEG